MPCNGMTGVAALLVSTLAWCMPASAASDSGPWVVPFVLEKCSERYGREKMVAQPRLGRNAEAEVRRLFDVDSYWGVRENVDIVEPDFTDGPVIEVRYPAGSSSPNAKNSKRGGAGFYAVAGLGEGRNTACLAYKVFVPEDFEFVRGGKLPGLYGGEEPPSGGDRPQGDDGFTLRLMWRVDGAGELYLYAPNMVPTSDTGGQSLGRGAWTFARNAWTEVELEVVLNQPGEANGTAAVWINGEPKMLVTGIRYRKTDEVDIAGLMFSTFFGGTGKRYAPDEDQALYFDALTTYGLREPEIDKRLD